MRFTASIAALITLSATGLAACAPTTPAAEGTGQTPVRVSQCFDADQLRNFRSNRDDSLYVRTVRNEVFELKVSAGCHNIDSAVGIALVPGMGSISRLCAGDWTNVEIGGGGAPLAPCRAVVERRLTPEEVAALPDRDRP